MDLKSSTTTNYKAQQYSLTTVDVKKQQLSSGATTCDLSPLPTLRSQILIIVIIIIIIIIDDDDDDDDDEKEEGE